MKHWAIALAFVGLCAGASAESAALTAEEGHVVLVRHTDLDLAADPDARALVNRLERAAKRACTVDAIARPNASARRAIAACQRDALERAVAAVNAPAVTRLHTAAPSH